MSIREFRLEELLHLDGGRVVEAFNQLLKRAALDCDDRPGVKEARKVILQTELVPILDPQGFLEDIKVTFQLKESEPTRKTRKYSVGFRKSGKTQMVFNDLADDNVQQQTFDEGDDE